MNTFAIDTLPFNDDQARLLVDATNQYEQWLSAKKSTLNFTGWMSWRKKGDAEYLTAGQNGGENQKSLGKKSIETTIQYNEFISGKEESKIKLEAIESRLSERAPMLKALRMGRILAPLAQIIREFDIHNILGDNLLVAGTHAICAYESMAGQWFDSSLSATEDLDFMWRSNAIKANAELLVKKETPSLLKHLKAVDNSYTVNTERTFQARNAKGLIIDFITSRDSESTIPREYLKPITIIGQEWLLDGDTVQTVVIDTQGMPVRLYAPDPRLFALHKLWVSERADRNNLKKTKDLKQGLAIARLVDTHLHQYPFNEAFCESLNTELLDCFERHIKKQLATKPKQRPKM